MCFKTGQLLRGCKHVYDITKTFVAHMSQKKTTAQTLLPALSFAFSAWLDFVASLQLMLNYCFHRYPLHTPNPSPPLFWCYFFHCLPLCA